MSVPLVQWLARLTTIQEVPGSIPEYNQEIYLRIGYRGWN